MTLYNVENRFVCTRNLYVRNTKLSFIFYYNYLVSRVEPFPRYVRYRKDVFDVAGVRDYQVSWKAVPFTDPLKLPELEIF